MTRDDTNDAAGDYVYLLNEAQDRMEAQIKDSLYGAKANGMANLDGKLFETEKLLVEATDLKGAPDVEGLALYVMEHAMEGDAEAIALVDKLIHAYAQQNAEVNE
jgi:hypothetical protein